MKVLALKFRNLNSLKGDHSIDFTKGSFRHTGIFAITGPTGAGKTTILDAITLGLYGRAARYSKSQPFEVMSRHTGECFSEVHFEIGEGRFGARWELRRARGRAEGSLQSPRRSVFALDTGELLVERVREVDQWIEESIGLDYDRFLRSVLLAQGEFTAFLKASAKERGTLLERLTGMGIYAELSQLTYQVTREKRDQFEFLERGLSELKVLSEDERKSLLENTAAIRQEEQAQRKRVGDLQERLEIVKMQGALVGRNQRFQQDRQQWVIDSKEAEAKLLALGLHRKAEPFAETIRLWRKLNEDLPKLQEREGELVTDRARLNSRLRECELREKESNDKLEKAIQCLAESRLLVEKVIPVDERLRGRAERKSQLASAREASQKDCDSLRKQVHDLSERLAEETRRVAELEVWFADHEQDGRIVEKGDIIMPLLQRNETNLRYRFELEGVFGERKKRLEELKKSLEVRQNEVSLWKQREVQAQEKLAKEERELLSILGGQTFEYWETRQRRLGEERLRVHPALDRLEQRGDRGAKLKVLKAKIVENQTLLAEYQDQLDLGETSYREEKDALDAKASLIRRAVEIRALREDLRDAEPCPVCGSRTHPGGVSLGSDHDQKVHQEREQTLVALRKVLDRLNTERLLVRERLQVNKADEVALGKEIDELNLEVEDLLEDLNLPRECYEVEGLSKHYVSLQQEQLRVDQRISEIRARKNIIASLSEARARTREQYQTIEALLAREAGQEQELKKAETADAEKLTLLNAQLKDGEEALQHLIKELGIVSQQSFQITPEALQTLTRRWSEQQKTYTDLKQNSEKNSIKLKGIEKALLDASGFLSGLEKDQRLVEDEIRGLNKERAQLCGEVDPFEWRKQCEEAEKQSMESLAQVQAERTHLREEFRIMETRLLDLHKERERLRGQHSETERELSKAAADEEQSLDHFVASYLDGEQLRSLEQCERALRDKELDLQSRERQLKSEQEELLTRCRNAGLEDISGIDADELAAELEVQQNESEKLKRELWNLEHRMKEDDERRREQTTRQEECERARGEWQRWSALDRLIGSADGAVFSRFAQSLTLGCLVKLANGHLQRLTDRYQIIQKDPTELEIEVIDRYQANTVRGMQSLSGGEGFLISLGLALGLSALAGGRIRIDSLFIDEGFGSLDAETLEIAIAALESLQSQNKMIGVISHMDLLKERIGTQIQVIQGEGGVSRFRVV